MGTVADLSVTTAKLAAGAVTNAKVNATAAIVKSKLAALAIENADLSGAAAISAANIADQYVKGDAASTTGDKDVIAIGWDNVTAEVVIDRQV